MEIERLREWAQALRITPGHEGTGAAILAVLDDAEAIENALWQQEINGRDDLVVAVESVLERYAYVRDTFTAREEFDLAGPDYRAKLPGVLALGDKAQSFKYRVVGVLRKAGALPEGALKLDDASLLMILEMMMP